MYAPIQLIVVIEKGVYKLNNLIQLTTIKNKWDRKQSTARIYFVKKKIEATDRSGKHRARSV